MSLLAAAQPSTNMKLGIKILNFSQSGLGKSHDFYTVAPRPLLVGDSDASAGAFNRDGFEGFSRVPLSSLAQLQALCDELIAEAEKGNFPYRSLFVDSMTVLVDKLIAELGIDMSGAVSNPKGQASFAREAKGINRRIRILSGYGIHFFATSEERNKYAGGKIDADNAEAVSSLSDSKFRYAFDFIYGKQARDVVLIDKSRFADWQEGQTYEGFDAMTHLTPLIAGTAKKAAGLDGFDPATSAHDELMSLLKAKKSVGRGGVIPDAAMLEYVAMAKNNALESGVVRKAINDLLAQYPDAVAHAAAA